LAASDRTGYLWYFLAIIFTTEDWDYGGVAIVNWMGRTISSFLACTSNSLEQKKTKLDTSEQRLYFVLQIGHNLLFAE
jgi:hypothetical protein